MEGFEEHAQLCNWLAEPKQHIFNFQALVKKIVDSQFSNFRKNIFRPDIFSF
jgi:hypothetical protein